ncbi:MAG: putative porin, partial [Spirochaetia bacterium]|nr:putative porin [Spirochaetia bacterium]
HGGFLWTGHGVDSGGARDEDFFTDSRTREVGAKVDLAHGTFRDTANTFQGTRNWADAKARATIVEYRIHTDARWYPGDTLHGTRDGFYVTAGLSYEFFWYHVFDVVQFIDSRPIFLGPIGDGLTFSNNITELPVGAGWTLKWKALTFDSNVRIVTGENRARDFHIQRGINFLAHTYGSGFRWSVSAKAQATSEWKFGIDWEARRFFGRGQVKTTGLNLVYNFAPPQRVYIDTKESWMGLSAVYLFNTPPAARQQSPSETDPLNKQR